MNETKRCGSCHFTKLVQQDLMRRVCVGLPPVPVQMNNTVAMMRPIVSVNEDACALYRNKSETDVANDLNAMRVIEQLKKQLNQPPPTEIKQ